jgi:hypothetical protein
VPNQVTHLAMLLPEKAVSKGVGGIALHNAAKWGVFFMNNLY